MSSVTPCTDFCFGGCSNSSTHRKRKCELWQQVMYGSNKLCGRVSRSSIVEVRPMGSSMNQCRNLGGNLDFCCHTPSPSVSTQGNLLPLFVWYLVRGNSFNCKQERKKSLQLGDILHSSSSILYILQNKDNFMNIFLLKDMKFPSRKYFNFVIF